MPVRNDSPEPILMAIKLGGKPVKKAPSQTAVGKIRNAYALSSIALGDPVMAYIFATADSPIKTKGRAFLKEYFTWEAENGVGSSFYNRRKS